MLSKGRQFSLKVLVKHFIKDVIRSKEIWLISTFSLLTFAIISINNLNTVSKDYFFITSCFYKDAIFISLIINSLFISLMELIHVSKDIDSRVYESYLYGPIDEISYMLSIFITYGFVGFFSTVFIPVLWMIIVNFIVGIKVTSIVFIFILMSYPVFLCILLLGLWVGSLGKSPKNSLIYLLLIILILVGIILSNQVISQYLIPQKKTDADFFSFFRKLFSTLSLFANWVSPFSIYYLFQEVFITEKEIVIRYILEITVFQFIFYFMSYKQFKRRLL